jgi:hypothetical protein
MSQAAGERRTLERVASSGSVLFVIAITIMVNYLAFRRYERFDLTQTGVYTLSPKSAEVIRGLKDDVDIYLFLSNAEPQFKETDELLQRYRILSPHVRVHYVDPDREPAEFRVLAQRFGILAGVIETGEARADVAAVVTRGEEKWHIDREDLLGWAIGMGGEDKAELAVKAEQALTGAIVQVSSGRATKVCVTQGHGELGLEEGTERTVASLKLGLRHDNIEWEALSTLGKKEIPKSCDAVFVLGPMHAFAEQEAALLDKYLNGGGRALLALDPVIENDEVRVTGLEKVLQGVGIRLDHDVVLERDEERLVSPNMVQFLATEFGDHETTRALVGRARVLVVLARSVAVTRDDGQAEVLMRTSEQAFGETKIGDVLGDPSVEPERGPDDVAGPVPLAIAVTLGDADDDDAKKKAGRLIVVGDSDFLQGALLESPDLANFHLASAWTGWLTERPALIEIPPKKVKGGSAFFTQDDLTALFFRVGVLIPGIALILGLAVWLNRRA